MTDKERRELTELLRQYRNTLLYVAVMGTITVLLLIIDIVKGLT